MARAPALLCLTCVACIACSIPELDGADKECPCAEGWVCDESRNRCVQLDDAGSDAADPDAGPSDAGFDAETDAEIDARADDASTDASPDAMPEVDASAATCPHDGLYCITFEEDDPAWEERGTDLFEIRMPGQMSLATGYFFSSGNETYVELENIDVPRTVHARLWMRVDMGSFLTPEPVLIGGLFLGDVEDGAGLVVQNEFGTIRLGFTNIDGVGVTDTYSPVTRWTCVQLTASPTRLSMRIDEASEVTQTVSYPDVDWEDFAVGIFSESLMGSGISIDEIVIGASPIPCAL